VAKQKVREKHGAYSGFEYKLMSFGFKVRDIVRPRNHILKEVGIKTCSQVLDYGCGPGGYVLPVIKLIGNLGTLYTLDINPMAIKAVQTLAAKKKLSNIRPILSDCDTGLKPASIDVVLLYDILHELENRDTVLKELYRVLKPDGILSLSDHHLEDNQIINRITKGGLFKLKSKGKKTLSFIKANKKK
jgi:ubiquinone/menaquinone biosynthesis C-methylase UbiE